MLKLKQIPFRTLSFAFFIFHNTRFATIGKSAGFYCDDASIKEPFHGDSIGLGSLFGSLLCINVLIIYLSISFFGKELQNSGQKSNKTVFKLHLKYYYSGILHTLAVMELVKVFVSELRPHFFYSCMPDMSNIDCSKGLITDFNCTGDGPQWLVERDIYKSFPSGHAALTAYAFVFITVLLHYIKHKAPKTNLTVWWVRFIPLLCLLWSIICCVSRILDNRHFWWDVLSGFVMGVVFGFVTVYFSIRKAGAKTKSHKS